MKWVNLWVDKKTIGEPLSHNSFMAQVSRRQSNKYDDVSVYTPVFMHLS